MKLFNSVPVKRPKKNKFDLSHEKKLSFQMGKLIPMMVQEILPGDSFKVNSEIMIRLAPMIAPIMHRVNVYTHYFFVPNRIIWNEWEDFITGGKDGTSAPVHPHILLASNNYQEFTEKSLADYMGFPIISSTTPVGEKINSLPFRAYQEIYNEYYRDQNLSNPVDFSKGSGAESLTNTNNITAIRFRAWEKDYFTSALPWTQRGPEVTIPFSAEVNYKTISEVYNQDGSPAQDTLVANTGQLADSLTTPNNLMRIENIEDITNGTSTINDLRRSVRLQEWLEKNARGGARYIEQLLSHWGAAPKDARLQRPEYLGGGKQPVVISEVLNTAGSQTVDLEPVGQMAGHGISVGNTNGFKRNFEEHGYVIGIMSVIPKTAYYQGVHKMWTRQDKLEYAWPEFAQLGEQPIQKKEIYFTGVETTKDETFGYTPRYSEYKYGQSSVHGEFRNSLDFWHLGRKFAALPPLNEGFVTVTPDATKRIFAVTDTDSDDIYCQIYHNVSALRPLPYYGTPTL